MWICKSKGPFYSIFWQQQCFYYFTFCQINLVWTFQWTRFESLTLKRKAKDVDDFAENLTGALTYVDMHVYTNIVASRSTCLFRVHFVTGGYTYCLWVTAFNSVGSGVKQHDKISPAPNGVFTIFRRNTTHCISPYAIVVCVWVSVRVCVCACVCMPRLWTSGKHFDIETSFFSNCSEWHRT